MAENAQTKRKYPLLNPSGGSKPDSAARKRARNHDARALAVQSADAALSATGELDVAAYVGAREYEIRALEAGIDKSKGALASRAFQKVPRSLRRRTASHNVKRVPRRLRARAQREMIEDNTPTVTARRRKPSKILRIRLGTARRLQSLNKKTKAKRAALKAKRDEEAQEKASKEGSHTQTIAPGVPKIKRNKLSQPSPPVSKYRKRQRSKTWLPTHMFHAKRACMTPPGEPLWRFAVPLTPTEKSYRPTHRAAGSRGAIAWDMSYMSTIQLEGAFTPLQAVLKSMRVEGDDCWGPRGRKWRQGTRVLQKWIHEADEARKPIAPVTMIWCAKTAEIEEDQEMKNAGADTTTSKKPQARDKLFIRVHPSAFLQLWNVLLSLCKKQNPPVTMQDLRFDIGSIEITGPGSTEALMATMNPFNVKEPTVEELTEAEGNGHATTWKSLIGVSNPSSLPNGALLSFSISDPRLHYPLKTLNPPRSESDMNNLASVLSSWPPDRCRKSPALFDRSARLIASRRLPSQKAINRRRTLAGPGERLKLQPTDPQIPIMVYASRPQTASTDVNNHGTWTVLLPWKCVAPLWYVLMYYPLSSGDNPRFGGVKEQRQLAFEYGQPWFPGDYPGTRAGWEWNAREDEERRKEWERKPKGKRVEFDSLDLGNGQKGEFGRGWACDWEGMARKMQSNIMDETQDTESSGIKDMTDPKLDTLIPPLGIKYLKLDARTASQMNSNVRAWKFPDDGPYLATVRVILLGRGSPTPCARIYRLPLKNDELCKQWLSTRPSPFKSSPGGKAAPVRSTTRAKSDSTDSEMNRQQDLHQLTASFAEPPSEIPLPPEDDIIGFISSGNYNLTEGKGTGIGSILVSKVIESPAPQADQSLKGSSERRMCIIRSPGERVGRLALWEFV